MEREREREGRKRWRGRGRERGGKDGEGEGGREVFGALETLVQLPFSRTLERLTGWMDDKHFCYLVISSLVWVKAWLGNEMRDKR